MAYLKFVLSKFISHRIFLMAVASIVTGFVYMSDDFTPPSSKPDLHWVTLKDVHIPDGYRSTNCLKGIDQNGKTDCLSHAVINKFMEPPNVSSQSQFSNLIDEGEQLTLGWYYTCETWRRDFHSDSCKRVLEVHHKGDVIVSYEDSIRYSMQRNTLESKLMFNLFFIVGFILICGLTIFYFIYPPKFDP